tara:strand:+ start:50 stop:373 length:324 start_codon:yes stop_codon:yes gene_type:complete
MLKVTLFLLVLLFSSHLYSEVDNDQWQDTGETYVDLINQGFEVKGYDMTNFKDEMGNLYLFFVTVLQKNKIVYECQEYQVFDNTMDTISLTFVCRKLVKPYKKGLKT